MLVIGAEFDGSPVEIANMKKNSLIFFNIYGYTIRIESSDYDLSKLKMSEDFRYFQCEKSADSRLQVQISQVTTIAKSDFKGFKIGRTEMCEVRQVSFSTRQLIYRCQNETLAVVSDRAKKIRYIEVKTLNCEILEDVLYFLINSCVGEHMDSNGLMRIHAVSFKKSDKIGLIYGSQGSGKSTLALSLLALDVVQLYSDEVSVFDIKNKTLHPYPIRIASLDLPADKPSLSKFNYFFNKKKLVAIPPAKIALSGALTHLYSLNQAKSSVGPSLIVGIGLIQMWEYLLRFNNLPTLVKIFVNRIQMIFLLARYPFIRISRNSSLSAKIELITR